MYNIGDKFIIKIGDILHSPATNNKLYKIEGFNSLVFDESGLDRLQKMIVEKEIKNEYDKELERFCDSMCTCVDCPMHAFFPSCGSDWNVSESVGNDNKNAHDIMNLYKQINELPF